MSDSVVKNTDVIDLDGPDAANTVVDVYGWKIHGRPPAITSVGGYSDNVKTETQQVLSSSIPQFPTCSVTPGGATHSNYFNVQDGSAYNSGGQDYWSLPLDTWPQLTLAITTPVIGNVEMVIHLESPLEKPVFFLPTVMLNGVNYTNKGSYNSTALTISYTIVNGMLQGAPPWNIISITNTPGGGATLNISSIELTGTDVTVTASYYWQRIFQDTLVSGHENDTVKHIKTVGNTTSNSETTSFSESIGISIGGKFTEGLAEISTKLTAGFTASKSSTTEISITESHTEEFDQTYSLPASAKSYTFELWQLHLVYECGTKSLDQAMSPGEAPILLRSYTQH